jgi:hypothetical protein
MAEFTPLAALGKLLGALFTDPDLSLGRLAPVSHDERMNRFQRYLLNLRRIFSL